MAAMIYYNRGVDLLAEKRFAEAAAANAKALRLDPSNATAGATCWPRSTTGRSSWATPQHFAEAVDLLRQGLAMDAKFEAFAQNYVHVHHQWVEQLCRQGRFEEASRFLSRAAAEMPDRDYLRRVQSEVPRAMGKAIAASSSAGAEWLCFIGPPRIRLLSRQERGFSTVRGKE